MGMTDTEKKMAFLLSTSPYLDVLDGSYDKAAKDLIANGIAPVRHGRWVTHYRSGTTVAEGYVSTCCDMWNNRKSDFCPNCGAKMDGAE